MQTRISQSNLRWFGFLFAMILAILILSFLAPVDPGPLEPTDWNLLTLNTLIPATATPSAWWQFIPTQFYFTPTGAPHVTPTQP